VASGATIGGVTFVGLWAPGGMGKTSLQYEYCNAHYAEFEKRVVLLRWKLRIDKDVAAGEDETVALQKEALRKLAGVLDPKLTFITPDEARAGCAPDCAWLHMMCC
jgi:hypothetical protein